MTANGGKVSGSDANVLELGRQDIANNVMNVLNCC